MHEHDGELPTIAQNDLVLTLLAASELPGRWKEQAITRARSLSQNMRDCYLGACVAHRDSTRYRILGRLDQSRLALSSFHNDASLPYDYQTGRVIPRVHAQLGHLTVSSAINFLQREKMKEAIDELDRWKPINPASPSTMERVVLYHINLTVGKVLRYQGHFPDALACLNGAFSQIRQDDLFNEVRHDLSCNLADVYIEMDDPISAKQLLQVELNLLNNRRRGDSIESRLLKLSLAEASMRQAQYYEAEVLYSEIQACHKCASDLTRVGKLRLCIGLARISHMRAQWADAHRYWTEALALVNKHYPLHNGHTSAVILYSMHHVLLERGEFEWSQRSLEDMKKMESAAEPGGCQFWIAGLRSYWFDYVRTALGNAFSST